MNKNEIILVGGGGHCKSCIDVIEAEGKFTIKGIIDLPTLLGVETLGYKVIGNDDDIPDLVAQGFSFLVTMGHMGNANRRNTLFNHIKSLAGNLPIIVSPKAHLSTHSKVGSGTIIMHGAVVNSDAHIGANSIINNLSLIEHDAVIEDHCHISTGALINGNCQIGQGSFIGSGAVVRNGLRINNNVVIGAGAVVVKDVPKETIFVGIPAKKIKND